MKATELIARLNSIIEEQGDLEVGIPVAGSQGNIEFETDIDIRTHTPKIIGDMWTINYYDFCYGKTDEKYIVIEV